MTVNEEAEARRALKDVARYGLVLAGFALLLYGGWRFNLAIDTNERASAEYIRDMRQHGDDAVACRMRGGLPIFSGWDGFTVVDCKPLPLPPKGR